MKETKTLEILSLVDFCDLLKIKTPMNEITERLIKGSIWHTASAGLNIAVVEPMDIAIWLAENGFDPEVPDQDTLDFIYDKFIIIGEVQ